MTRRGVRFDTVKCDKLNDKFKNKEKKLMKRIKDLTNLNVEIWAAASIAKAFDALNLPYERMYFTKGSDMNGVDRFLKNYEFICENPDNDFFVNVLANKKLKSEFTWGRKTNGRLGITKDEYFSKLNIK
jgi:hypothetical protein